MRPRGKGLVLLSVALPLLAGCGGADPVVEGDVASVPISSPLVVAPYYTESFDAGNNGYIAPDWAYGDFKGQCRYTEAATGLCASAIGMRPDLRAHSILCAPASYYGTGARLTTHSLAGADDRGDTATGDWDYGYVKAECAAGEAITGVAQSPALNIDKILCTSTNTGVRSVDTACQTLVFSSYTDNRLGTASGDWAVGYSKNECLPYQILKGVSRKNTGEVHAILCCNQNTAAACAAPGPHEVSTFSEENYGGLCRVFDEGTYSLWALAPMPNDQISSVKIPSGVRLLLSEHDYFGGRQFYYDGGWNYAGLGDVNNLTSSLEVLPARGGPVAAWFVGNYPTGRPYWAEEVQGVAHDSYYWYITQKSRINRIPLTTDLASASYCASCSAGIPPAMTDYDHFGDPDQFGGFLFVPVQGRAGSGAAPAVAVFTVPDLQFWMWQTLPGVLANSGLPTDGTGAWLAFRPGTYTLVLSPGAVGGPNNLPLYEYSINWTQLRARLPFLLTPLWSNGKIPLVARSGGPVGQLDTVQGGAFNQSGEMLYLSNGYCDTDTGFISAFYVPISGSDPYAGTGVLQAQSVNGSGPFNFQHQGGGSCSNEEPEGLDFFDVSGRGIPNIPGGQVHALVIDNNYFPDSADGVNFKHYSY